MGRKGTGIASDAVGARADGHFLNLARHPAVAFRDGTECYAHLTVHNLGNGKEERLRFAGSLHA
jgi:hypothetical protein